MRNHTPSARTGNLPNWAYLLLGFLAPLSVWRVKEGINFTFFDLLILAVGVLLLLRGILRRMRVPGPVIGAGYLLIMSLLLATLRASDLLEAIEHILQCAFVFFIVIPVTYSAFRSRRAFLLVTIGFMLGMAVVAFYGIYDVLYVKHGLRYRYSSIFDKAQPLGFQIAVTIPFLLFLLRHRKQVVSNRFLCLALSVFALAVTGILIWLLPYSLSRTGAVAAAAGIVVFFSLAGSHRQLFIKTIVRASLVVVLLVVGFMIYLQTWAPDRVVARVESSLSLESPEVTDRTQSWKKALAIDPSYYFVGAGPDNYDRVFGEIKPHNVILLLLAEGGILAALMFTAILGLFFQNTISALRFRSTQFSREFLVATIASMSSYVVIAMLNTVMIQRFHWFVLTLGLSAASQIRCRSIGFNAN